MHGSRTRRIAGASLTLLVVAARAEAQPAMTAGFPLQDSRIVLSMGGKCAQHKLAFVGGAWWGVLSTAGGVDFHRLDPATNAWSRAAFRDAHVTDDAASRADVVWTGTNLLVLTDERVAGVTKLRLRAYDFVGGAFVLRGGFPSDVVTGTTGDKLTANVQTVVVDSLGRAWVTYRSGTLGLVRGSAGTGAAGWISWLAPVAVANLEAGLGDTPGYLASVTFDGKTGVFWPDQRAGAFNAFRFRWRPDAAGLAGPGDWAPEEVVQATNEDLADDHVNLQSFEGKVYCVVKTNLNLVGRPIFELFRRDASGTWNVWPVLLADGSFRDNATRPILVLEPGRRLVHVFYNGGGGVAWKRASMDAPDFSAKPVAVVASAAAAWNTQSTAQLVDGAAGLVVVCDAPGAAMTWQFWGRVAIPAVTTGPLASIAVVPGTASLVPGATLQLTARGGDAQGNPVAVTPAWTATGGTIDATGLYSAGTTPGTFTVTATSGSISGRATVTVAVPPVVPPPGEVVVDDGTAGFAIESGKWELHFHALRYGPTDRSIAAGGTGAVRWRPTLPGGTYDVFAWVPSRYAAGPALASYEVTTTAGTATALVEQALPSAWGTWQRLGTFALDGTASVRLVANPGQSVAADAVRFVRVGP